MKKKMLSIIVPMFNEESNIAPFFESVVPILERLEENYEVVCVNDGSSDKTLEFVEAENRKNPFVKAIHLSRNFGKEIYRGRPITFARSIDRLNQSLVLMMDVLEHVDDDAGLLRRYVRRMPAGARVLVTVPAFQCLWSGHDAFLVRKRRYTRRMVEKCMREAGLAILDIRFFSLCCCRLSR